ncbi:hypothetical protein ACIRPQ_01270 [Streptomyces sp. NPDC101213]|uniref:hypothetical protein n=1 Tax=unclassified Streptomyces TaxID=2593676 RepID=UPI003702991A
MKFVLEVAADEGASAEERAREPGRVLRYWGGNPGHCAPDPGDGSPVYDSEYREVGQWRVVTS